MAAALLLAVATSTMVGHGPAATAAPSAGVRSFSTDETDRACTTLASANEVAALQGGDSNQHNIYQVVQPDAASTPMAVDMVTALATDNPINQADRLARATAEAVSFCKDVSSSDPEPATQIAVLGRPIVVTTETTSANDAATVEPACSNTATDYSFCKDVSSNDPEPATQIAVLGRPIVVTTEELPSSEKWVLVLLGVALVGLAVQQARTAHHRALARMRATTRIQAVARGLAPRAALALRRSAAADIQVCWRLRCEWVAMQAAYWRLRQGAAATYIQSWARQMRVFPRLQARLMQDAGCVEVYELALLRPELYREHLAASRIQAAVRGFGLRVQLSSLDLLRAAVGGTLLQGETTLVYNRLSFGKAIGLIGPFDRNTGECVHMGTLLKRYGKAKKATSAKKQRERARRGERMGLATSEGKFIETKDGAIYVVTGTNAIDKALLRKRLGGRERLQHAAVCAERDVDVDNDDGIDEDSLPAAHVAAWGAPA